MSIRPKKILCAIDFSEFTDAILSFGASLGKRYSAKLLLVHVTVDVTALLEHHETNLDVKALQQTNLREAKARLAGLAQNLAVENEIVIRKGNPADEISRIAVEQEADMVITATHGNSGFKRLLLGSVTEKLIKALHCPLLVLPAHDDAPKYTGIAEIAVRNILVGCDFSPDAELALTFAVGLAEPYQAALCLAHVIKPSRYRDKREALPELHSRLEKQLDDMVPVECREWCRAESILLEGDPSVKLMAFAEQRGVDMIVLGVRGHTLLEKLLVGSTTDRVIRQANLPVLVVRQIH